MHRQTRERLFTDNFEPTNQLQAFLEDVQIPGTTLEEIDDALQARFFQIDPLTKQPLERWELKEVETTCSTEKIKDRLAALGFIYGKQPTQFSYDRAAWPGGLAPRAAVRLTNLVDAWKAGVRWNETIIFGSKRELQPAKENLVACCQALGMQIETEAEAYDYGHLWKRIEPKTELDMMRYLWEAACLTDAHPGALSIPADLKNLATIFVDAPMKPPAEKGGKEIRPNTEDTIRKWLADEKPKPGFMLLSSGAPYGPAQEEAFRLLIEPLGHTIETFGHEAPNLPIENFLREVAGTVNRVRKARKT